MNEELLTQATARIEAATSEAAVEALRVELVGRKGTITELLRKVGELPETERAGAGQEANRLRQATEQLLSAKTVELRQASEAKLASTPIDVTAPGKPAKVGHRHPVSLVLDELVQVFWQMGYQVADGPEVESQWYNFEALNLGVDHPARDTQDTFYLENGHLPRTHTSGVQIRHMEGNKPPIRIISPGKVYRNEDEDATHSWTFHQLEGLVVDANISLADLKGTLYIMLQGVLGEGTELRLRPNYFPYTEPSVEMDARLPGGPWLELGGAGMVHPQVLRNVGIDPEQYSGFAFGFGPERIAALKYGVGDVREFWRPSLPFLEQF
jgi:phenylalanyl-tRNA synthetase alpha chain